MKSIKADLTANYDPRYAIQMLGVTDPRLLSFLVGFTYIRLPGNITLEWHEAASYTGEGKVEMVQESAGMKTTLDWTFLITFHPTSDGKIEGDGVLTNVSATLGSAAFSCVRTGVESMVNPPMKVTGTVKPDGTFQLNIYGLPGTLPPARGLRGKWASVFL